MCGEFDDGALLKALGHQGHGVFMAPIVLHDEVCRQYEAVRLGVATDLIEEFYVISVERRITHPGVAAITQAARAGLFALGSVSAQLVQSGFSWFGSRIGVCDPGAASHCCEEPWPPL